MNLKKKLRSFFTLSRRANDGFTLVELIVVIAILAILAGVAVPAYSGYVKKANEAADQQLLAAVNTAFAAACIENGIDAASLEDGSVDVVWTEKCVTGVSLYNEEFQSYYGTNAASAFKVYEALEFVGGVFVAPGEGSVTSVDLPGGGKLHITQAQLAAIKKSVLSGDIGSLMSQVDGMGSIISELLAGSDISGTDGTQNALDAFLGSDAYMINAIVAMGGTADPSGDLQQQYNTALNNFTKNQAINKLAAELGKDPNEDIMFEDPVRYNELVRQFKAEAEKNILVLGIAQSAATQSKGEAMAVINSGDPKKTLLQSMIGQGADVTSGMGNAALVYGVFTAYAKSDSATDTAKGAVSNSGDPSAVFDALEDPDTLAAFRNYMGTQQGQDDMDACIAAMGVINNTAKDPDAAGGVLANGFNNAEFISALESLFK